MANDSQHNRDDTSVQEFKTSANSRAGWVLIGGLVGLIVLIVCVELIRRM